MGISADPSDRQNEFDTAHSLRFPLLSDPERAVARQLGVKRWGPVPSKRATFVIDETATVIGVISSETNMNTHADEALAVLRQR